MPENSFTNADAHVLFTRQKPPFVETNRVYWCGFWKK